MAATRRRRRRKKRCTTGRPYAVELDSGAIYVGSTSKSATTRYAEHKRGGRTSSAVVRKEGRRLRKDLARGARTERGLAAKLRREGYRVPNDTAAFCGPTRKKRRRRRKAARR